ncbi:shieldin complex subunit 3 [Diretmus argenteus]
MEDVVLHYKPGSASQLDRLLERTEKLLEPFPCRVPPVFTPWFPPAADCWLPIRPSRPAPIITAATAQEVLENAQILQDSSVSERPLEFTPTSVQRPPQPNTQPGAARPSSETPEEHKDGVLVIRPEPHTQEVVTKLPENTSITERRHDRPLALICVQPQPNAPAEATTTPSPEKLHTPEDGVCVPETPDHLPPASPQSLFGRPEPNAPAPGKQQQKPKVTHGGEVKRSWSVFPQKGVLVQNAQSMSKQFHRMVGNHKLHLRQRAKWVICQQNCGAPGDIEQVWRDLSRAVRRCRLPTCNANIQRDQAEIWVFCDVLYCESVGKYLKEELQLSGNIRLSVHKLGTIFSL